MRRLIGISAVALLAGIAGSDAQSPAPQVPQGTAGQNSTVQQPGSGTAPRVGPTEAEAKSDHSGPPYGDCYLKCINTGNPADFCRSDFANYCY